MSKHKGGKGVARERKKARRLESFVFRSKAQGWPNSSVKARPGLAFVAELHGSCSFVMDQSHWETLQ